MARLLFGLAIVVVVGTVYTVIDCALRDASRIRGLSKPVWLVVILLIPVIGSVLWYVLGRTRGREPIPTPDDDTAFLGDLRRDSEQDRRIRLLEQELAALDSESDFPDSPRTDPDAPRTEPGAPRTDPKHDPEDGQGEPTDNGR